MDIHSHIFTVINSDTESVKYGYPVEVFHPVIPIHIFPSIPLPLSRWIFLVSRFPCILGSLRRNNNGDGNENGKKNNRFFWQNNNSARASRCVVHFVAVVARLQRESAQVHVLSRTVTQDNNFPFLFLNFDTVL